MSELHTFEIRQREGSKGAMTGANTELLIDGKPVPGAHSVKFEITAKGVAKVTIEAYGHLKASGKLAFPLELKTLQSEEPSPPPPKKCCNCEGRKGHFEPGMCHTDYWVDCHICNGTGEAP